MFYKKKSFYLFLSLFCIAVFSLVYVSILNNRSKPEITEPVIENQPNVETQAEIDPYDKTIYETEIVKYADVILPLNSTNTNYLNETLFVGDSNTEGIGAFEHLPMQNVLGKHSMNIQGFTSDDFLLITEDNPETEEDESRYITMFNVLAGKQPQRIIINFGTNNAGSHAVPAQFAKTYADTLNQIKTTCPNTKVIVAAILPVCKDRAYPKIKQDVIDLFNLELAQLCKENGYGFLHYPEVFKDNSTGYANADYFSADGVHLNGDGYRLLLDYAAKHQYN